MNRPTKAYTRLGAASVAAVVLGAGVPTYFAVSASAASNINTVKVTQRSTAADCTPGTVTGEPVGTPGQTRTVTVTQTVCVDRPVTRTVTVTPTQSQSPSPSATCTLADRPSTSITQVVIKAGSAANVTVTGTPGREVTLYAYTRPVTKYAPVRTTQVIPADGTLEFLITPPRNTRVAALYTGCAAPTFLGASDAVNVAYGLSVAARRNASRNYTFTGRLLPATAGQLISLYRVTSSGQQVLTAQVRAASNGTYTINRRFTGSGRFSFFTRAAGTSNNAAGNSNVRPTLVY